MQTRTHDSRTHARVRAHTHAHTLFKKTQEEGASKDDTSVGVSLMNVSLHNNVSLRSLTARGRVQVSYTLTCTPTHPPTHPPAPTHTRTHASRQTHRHVLTCLLYEHTSANIHMRVHMRDIHMRDVCSYICQHTYARTYARHTYARCMLIHLPTYMCAASALGQSQQGRGGSEGGGGRGRCGRGIRWRRSGRPPQHLTNAQTDVTQTTVSVHAYICLCNPLTCWNGGYIGNGKGGLLAHAKCAVI